MRCNLSSAKLKRSFVKQPAVVLGMVFSAVILMSTSASAAAEPGARFPGTPWGLDTAAGECVVCHSLEQDGPFRYAPNLYGIVGAEKARDRAWYGYSQALMTMGGTWTEEDLNAYLANASKFAPGTTKTIQVADPERRQDIIHFLKTLD